MIGNQKKYQQLPQKILPKKPSITSYESQDSIFYETLSGEFHTSWEHDLWDDVDVIPEDLDLDGLVQYTHTQSPVPSKEPQLSSDPMLSDVIQKKILIPNQTSGESISNNETVLFEMIVDHTDIPPPQDALILTNSNRDESMEDLSQYSVGFNESSESGFDDSFCGWEPASMLDSNSNEQEFSHEDILQTAMTENFPQPIEKQDMPRPTLPDNDQKKRVGRPRKTSVHTVASVPIRGPKKLIENMKRRRQRDLNNIASQKCRAKKKEELLNSAKDCEYQELRNKELKSQEKFLRERVERLRKILIRNGYCLPNLTVATAGL